MTNNKREMMRYLSTFTIVDDEALPKLSRRNLMSEVCDMSEAEIVVEWAKFKEYPKLYAVSLVIRQRMLNAANDVSDIDGFIAYRARVKAMSVQELHESWSEFIKDEDAWIVTKRAMPSDAMNVRKNMLFAIQNQRYDDKAEEQLCVDAVMRMTDEELVKNHSGEFRVSPKAFLHSLIVRESMLHALNDVTDERRAKINGMSVGELNAACVAFFSDKSAYVRGSDAKTTPLAEKLRGALDGADERAALIRELVSVGHPKKEEATRVVLDMTPEELRLASALREKIGSENLVLFLTE